MLERLEDLGNVDAISMVQSNLDELEEAYLEIKASDEGDIHRMSRSLNKLLEKIGHHISLWEAFGFKVTTISEKLERCRTHSEEYGKGDPHSFYKRVTTDVKDLYRTFLVCRREIKDSLILLEEIEELFEIDDEKVRLGDLIRELKLLDDISEVANEIASLRRIIYEKHDITLSDLKEMVQEYVRILWDELSELEDTGGNIVDYLPSLRRAKDLIVEKEVTAALKVCREIRMELMYDTEFDNLQSGEGVEDLFRDVIDEFVAQEGTSIEHAATNTIEDCDRLLLSGKELISKLHFSGQDVEDLIRIYMSARTPLENGRYDKVYDIAAEVNEIAQGMLAAAPTDKEVQEEQYEPRLGLDFEIVTDRYTFTIEDEELEDEEMVDIVEFQCSECGTFISADEYNCPNCGEVFQEGFEVTEEMFITFEEAYGKEDETAEVEIPEEGEQIPETPEIRDEKDILHKDIISSSDIDDVTSLVAEKERLQIDKERKKMPPTDQVMKLIETRREEAGALAEEEKYHKALGILNELLKIRPEHPALLSDKASFLFQLDEPEKALVLYDMALEADPDRVETWINKGYALHSLGNVIGAFYCYEKALALDTYNSEVLTSLGALYFKTGEFDKALRYFERATSQDPKDSDLWYYKGFIEERSGDVAEALASYDKALNIDPFHKEAILGRDKCRLKLKRENPEA